MKKFIFFLLLLLASDALYSQCYDIDETRIPFRRDNNYEGAVGFYTGDDYPSFMRSRYVYEMALTASGIYEYKVEFRMKVNSLNNQMYCFGKYNTAVDNGWYVSYNMDGNNYVEFYLDGNGIRIPFYYLNDNEYHNYMIYYNYITGILDFYVDDANVYSTTSSPPNIVDAIYAVFCVGYCGSPNRFGYSNQYLPSFDYDNYFRGYFDYIRINLGVEYPTPIYRTNFDWEFNEGAGDYAHDSITYFNGVTGGPNINYDPPTNHLMNGCGRNYDRFNAVWVSGPTSIPHFSAVGDGVKKFQGEAQTWEQSSVYGMTPWEGGLVVTGIIGWINNPSIIDTSGGDSAKNIAYYNMDCLPSWRDLDIGLSGAPPRYTNDGGFCVTVFDNKLVAAGAFAVVGRLHNVTALNIAILDSLNGLWRDLDSGLYGSYEPSRNYGCNFALEYKGDLYAGGNFLYAGKNHTICNNIARYNDTCWTDVDSGVNYDVEVMAIYDSLLYVGGGFTYVGSGYNGGILSRGVASWDGTNWGTVGNDGNTNGKVTTMCVYNDELYVAGTFTHFRGIECNGLIKYNKNSDLWSAPGTGFEGFDPYIYEMTVYNNELYIAGSFLKVNGVYCYNICKYSPETGFCAISNGLEGYGGSLAVYNNELYIGGHFYAAEDVYASAICKYNGGSGDNGDRVVNNMMPRTPQLNQNYPNPFNPSTNIKFSIPRDAKVSLIVYDILGREVVRLVNNEFKKAGEYKVDFNGTNYASGVYFYRLETDHHYFTKKMVLIK